LNKPSLDELMEKVDCRYTLVVVAAKRARSITEKHTDKTDRSADKPVSTAFQEIVTNRISYLKPVIT
jgi:DNA-directed RNA polymerase subunit omega